ncbi:SRPBCC family protein [Halosolutus gelatinilyticus]|uniref:SRPBCC family protein n=1 Tax=Halosolutus gelatinilyticus TaxID=2931975 RepID=UPI001FF45658|nr:SRPBCC family protein [Halosolutus gelatinilyticus]
MTADPQSGMDRGPNETTVTADPDDQSIVITRVFDAPRERVFEAYTDPDLIPEWWAPRRYTTTVDEMEVRRGGRWRFSNREPDGGEHAFHGVYHEITPPERLVQTFEYEGMPGHIALETAAFESVDGGTKLTLEAVYQSTEDRDGMLETGGEDGAIETIEQLAELLTASEEEERR